MIPLAEVEQRLALFAEGITGRYLHIRKADEQDDNAATASQTVDALYLPESISSRHPQAYHVLALQQIGQRECGTFNFDIQVARDLLPHLELERPGQSRDSDLTHFFRSFPNANAARRLFNALELIRINAHIRRAYPGAAKYMVAPDDDALIALGVYLEDQSPLVAATATVYDTATQTSVLYSMLNLEFVTPIATEDISGVEWMQRETRLEDWEQQEESLGNQMLAVEMLESEEVEARTAEDANGEVRDVSIDIAALQQDRDTLKRRIDMERAALRHASGLQKPAARSYRYDEWDMHSHQYLRKYCVLFEERLEADADINLDRQRAVVQRWLGAVKSQLEQIRPTGFQRIKRVLDGDELDINTVVEVRQDIRAGISPDERIYSRRERVHRDVCALFLVDLSASTDDPLEPVPPPELDEWGDPVKLRDPFEDHPLFAQPEEEEPDQEPPRKIIDIQREAMLVMSTALDALGDNFGIYGFSGYGHDCVEVFIAKEIGEKFSVNSLKSIGAMTPKRSTRMGPAIRHSCAKLIASGHAMKVLIIVSDGFPQDCDYGPDRSDHEYGLMDTAKALTEAAAKGVETFCITVDRSGHDYLKRMCPQARYMVIEEMEDLPAALSKVYSALTVR